MGGLDRQTQAAAGLARILARPMLDYQVGMAAALNRRADDGGPGYADPFAVVLLPRQVGKTSGIFLTLMGRTAVRRGYAAAYTAQSGIVVTHVFCNPGNGWLTMIDGHPMLTARWRSVRSQGREQAVHRGNTGAYIRAFPPIPGSLRSTSLDCVVMDECQEHSQEIGQALLADTGPTFATRPRRQLVLMGTAPADPSDWWADMLERARNGAARLIELGTWPEESDPEDPATWRAHHPGLRAGLTDETHLRSELARLGVERFAREYGNRIPGGSSLDTPLLEPLWRAAQYGGPAPPVPLAVGFDVAADGSGGAAVAVGRIPDGRTVAGIAAMDAGTEWLPRWLADVAGRWPRVKLIGDPTGPAAPVVDAARRAGLAVGTVPAAERLAAHGHLIAELAAGRAAVIGHPAMDEARRAARRRWTDAGGWVWSRRRSSGDISPLTAWTMAQWQARQQKPAARPRVVAAAGPG